ncbi:SubName: Full=Related to ERG20-Farnesyl-pyrophosphate synthetase {ECO:0000313/EMBL:CCA68513.1} [Serendipita indica DSM 11827]|nr:SubName: Full=Related to ERG20-Farnesyl-pyrophosphate synthetase {ECO:0000313/EMBL:CCA68513.1} [Serendipita indica DSM 11827]
MESYQIPHSGASVFVALFKNVTNAASLKKRLVTASTMAGDEGIAERAAVNFAFIDARLVTSKMMLETAIHQALLAEEQGALKTKYIHSEILWFLNPGNNISEAIRRFGVTESSTDIVVLRVFKDSEPRSIDVRKDMEKVVEGQIAPLEDLPTDWAALKKARPSTLLLLLHKLMSLFQYYKLGSDTALVQADSEEAQRRAVDRIVINTIAIKSVAS